MERESSLHTARDFKTTYDMPLIQQGQVLDFSNLVHEDLSNFDPNGAWVCLLDEFVDYVRQQRSISW